MCNRAYPLQQRLALFEQVVSSTLMYGAASWTMTAHREDCLTSAQRRMLRNMLSMPKVGDSLDDFVQWMRASTHRAEQHHFQSGGEMWKIQQRRRQWRWAGHVARMADGRWPVRILYWQPIGCTRRPGRPNKRRTDSIDTFMVARMGCAIGDWASFVPDQASWKE